MWTTWRVVAREFGSKKVRIFVNDDSVIEFVGIIVPVAQKISRVVGDIEFGSRNESLSNIDISTAFPVSRAPEHRDGGRDNVRIGNFQSVVGALDHVENIESTRDAR